MDTKAIEEINAIAVKLFSLDSVEELCKIIVEESKKLLEFELGALFLQENEKFERICICSSILQKFKIKKKYYEKTVNSRLITQLTYKDLKKTQPELLKLGIKSGIIVPLSHRTETIGLLFLFSQHTEKMVLLETNVTKLYASLISLAIAKVKLYEEMKNALEMRDRFISLASHELRTPLTSINGYIQLLYSKLAKQNTPESRWVEELSAESSRLTSLVKDLLDINRIKQGQHAFILSEVNLKKVVDKAIERLTITDQEREIVFEYTIKNNKNKVIGDFDKLLEMLVSILGNAIKFSPADSKIIITLSRKERYIVLSVKDFGKGIPKKDITGVFKGFYKTVHSKDKEGMGVGLLLAKHVIESHRGKMNIISRELKGTTVTISLPAIKI